MKNKKLAALVAIPMALSFTFGVSACSASTDPTKTPVEQGQVQGKVVDDTTAKTNAIETMTSVQKIFLDPLTAKHLMVAATGANAEEQMDFDGKIWKQLEPLLGIPADDEGLVKHVFGENPEDPKTAYDAKVMIIGSLMSEFYEVEPGEEWLPVESNHEHGGSGKSDLAIQSAKKYSYDFTSFKVLENGNILPQNQVMVEKDKDGSILDAKMGSFDFQFNRDGTKLIPSFLEPYNARVVKSLEDEAGLVALQIETYVVTILNEKEGKEMTRAGLDKYLKETVKFSEGNVMSLDYNEKDGNYVITVKNGEFKAIYDSANGGFRNEQNREEINKADHPVNLIADTMISVKELDETIIKAIRDGKYTKVASKQYSTESKGVVEIMNSSKISDDGSTLTALIDGIEFTFVIQ